MRHPHSFLVRLTQVSPCSNYEQIGLKFLLYSAEVLFNKGLSLIYLGRTQEGIAVMEEARQERATEEHNVIEDAIQDQGEGYTVFSIVRMSFLRQPIICGRLISTF